MAFQWFWVLALCVLPFTNNPASLHFPREFVQRKDQILIQDVSNFIKEKYPDHCIFYSNMCIWLNVESDPFNPEKAQLLYKIKEMEVPQNAILLWDNLFSVIDHGISLDNLRTDNRFQEVKYFENSDKNYQFAIFIKK